MNSVSSGSPDAAAPTRPVTPTARSRWMLAAIALTLLIASGRLGVIARFGSDLPVWDQWAAETNAFVMPLGDGSFGPRKLYLPTNEHRISFTLLTNGLLTAISGQWDARQQAVVNAFLYGAMMAALWYGLARAQGRAAAALLFLVVAFAGGLPLVFENILWGFQSQFFFVSGFSLYCIFQLLGARPGSWLWHTGWIAGVCAMLSLGSGFLAPLVVLTVSSSLVVFGVKSLRDQRLTLAAAVLLLVFAWIIHAPAPEQNLTLHAANPRQFLTYLLAGMAWPATDLFGLGLLAYLPGAVLACLWLRSAAWRQAGATCILAGLGWALLQSAALAYARSNTTMWPPANRYGDLYIYGALFNVAAAIFLLEKQQSRRGHRPAVALLLAPLVVFGIGCFRTTTLALNERLPATRREYRAFEKTIAAYLVSHDPKTLDQGAYPYPVRDVMVFMLEHPAIRARLPASVSPANAENGNSRSAVVILPSFLSRLALTISQGWLLILGTGVAIAGLVVWMDRPSPTKSALHSK